MFSLGMRTLSSFKKPLSDALKPTLGPISPTVIPININFASKIHFAFNSKYINYYFSFTGKA